MCILRHLGPHAPGATSADGLQINFTWDRDGPYVFTVASKRYMTDGQYAYRAREMAEVDVFYKGVRLATRAGGFPHVM